MEPRRGRRSPERRQRRSAHMLIRRVSSNGKQRAGEGADGGSMLRPSVQTGATKSPVRPVDLGALHHLHSPPSIPAAARKRSLSPFHPVLPLHSSFPAPRSSHLLLFVVIDRSGCRPAHFLPFCRRSAARLCVEGTSRGTLGRTRWDEFKGRMEEQGEEPQWAERGTGSKQASERR